LINAAVPIHSDIETGGDLLKDAAKRHPTAQTLCQHARFLYNVKKEYTAAWQLFEKALVADSNVTRPPSSLLKTYILYP